MTLNHSTITKRLKKASSSCKKAALLADETLFFTKFYSKWSIAENLIHLVKSVKGLNKAYAMPKEQLETTFGKPDHPSTTYEKLFERYEAILATNPIAPPAFTPQITEGDSQHSVLELFDKQHNAFIKTLKNFTETELDNYQVPHPVLGNLTVREMYYFTLFHIEHHTRTIETLVENQNLQAI